MFSDIVDLNDEALSTMTRGVIASLALPPSQTPWLEGPPQTRVETSAPTRVDAGSRPASKAPAPRSPAADSLAFDTTPAPRTDAQPKASPGAPAGRKIPLAWILGGAGVAALAMIGLLVVMLSGSDDSKQASRSAKKEKPSQPEAVAKPPAPKPAPPPAVVQAARIEVEMSAGQSKRLSIPIARSGAGSRASGTIEGVSFPPFVQCTSGTIGPADTEREVTLTVAPKTPLTGPEKVSGKVVVTLGGQVIETPVLLTLLPAVAAAPEIDPNAIAHPIRKLPEGEAFSVGVVYQANQTVRAVVAFSGANTADTKLSVVRADGQFVPFGETPGTLTFAALPNVPYRILVANRSKLPFDGVLHVTAPVMALAKVDPVRPPDPPPVDPVPPKPKEPEVKPKEPAPPKDPPGFPQEKEYVNAVGMKFMRVSAGTFLMGATHEEAKAFAVLKPLPTVFPEEPRHQVEISKDFYIGAHEVTQAQYQAVTGVNPSKFQDDPKLPVHNLKWSDAKRFCDKLSAQEGKIYRLPTEAEWEYACRAGTSTPFNVGKALFLTQARVASAISSKGTPPVRVGGYEANKWGLHDMHGNVWEYCEDHYHPTFYKNSPEKDPVNGWGTELHVLRGGSAGHDARFARSACRAWEVSGADISYNGFRVVLASASLAPSAPMVAEGPRFGGPQPPVGAGIRVLAEAAQLGAAVPTRNYPIRMLAGKTYVIAMNSGDFDAYLQLLGPVGNILARDDDSGGGRNARITYRCLKTGDYGIVARRFSEAGGGGFTLDVYER